MSSRSQARTHTRVSHYKTHAPDKHLFTAHSGLRRLGPCSARVLDHDRIFPSGVDFLFLHVRSLQAVDVGPEFDNLAQQVRRLALPIRQRFGMVGVARRELRNCQ